MAAHRTWTDAQLIDAVRTSISVAQVIRKLGLRITGGTYAHLQSHVRRLGVSTKHFSGQGWSRGRKGPDERLCKPLEEVLVNGRRTSCSWLRERLTRVGIKQSKCEECGLDEWRGQPIPLNLHHVNGDRSDNRLQNLQILCANCHAITPNFGTKRRA